MTKSDGPFSPALRPDGRTLLSGMIGALRFPLTVAIVCIHANLPEVVTQAVDSPVAYNLVHAWLAQVLARVAVPLFFWISGYLYFLKVEQLTAGLYRRKLLTRLRTLFVPYVWWNVAAVFITFLFHTYVFHFRSSVPRWGWHEWLSVLWDYRGDMPYNYPLWYVRNLLLMVVAAPLVWWLLRRWPRVSLLVAGVGWLLTGGYEWTTAFFFMLGAWMGIRKYAPVWPLWRRAWWVVAAYGVLSVAEAVWAVQWPGVLHQVNIALGMVAVAGLAARYVAGGRKPWPLLGASSFWVYATHVIVVGLTQTWLFGAYRPTTDGGLVAVYVGQVVWATGLTLALYALLHRCLPRLTALLTGGR